MTKGLKYRVRVSFDKVLEWEKRKANNPKAVILGEDVIINAGFTQAYFSDEDFDEADVFYRELARRVMKKAKEQPGRDRI